MRNLPELTRSRHFSGHNNQAKSLEQEKNSPNPLLLVSCVAANMAKSGRNVSVPKKLANHTNDATTRGN
jgi:hypothetical protein